MWSRLPGAEPPANETYPGSALSAATRSARVLYFDSARTKNPPYSAAICASGTTSAYECGVRPAAIVKVRELDAATSRLPSPLRLATTFAIATAPLPPGLFVTYIVLYGAGVGRSTLQVADTPGASGAVAIA